MHIPDGYLSPATCLVTLAIALPFWRIALDRLRRQLATRMVPQLALAAAFSFVIMMFNLPLPGGTTGHAVGMAVAAIALGPWNAVIAISLALFIQALFFGDGGLTAYGANCLNMAIMGPFVAHALYRLLAGHEHPRRQVLAAGLAGYAAINVAALLAAIEFGLQPLLFTDAGGAPLYAPYPLRIAVPAMMLGHLTFAGMAEALITSGVVAWLIRSGHAFPHAAPAGAARFDVRRLWAGLALLIALSPLGLLASGTAWGEWGAADFADPQARAAIASASGQMAPPADVPAGLQRLSELWQAPIPDYAPAFLQHAGLGYILSALAGTGLILLASRILLRRR